MNNTVPIAPPPSVAPPQPTYTQPPPAAIPTRVGERIVAIVPNLKKPKSFGRWDTYNLIVTDRRCIFATLTGDMLNRALKESLDQGKAQGKGFMDRWGDQMEATLGYWKRYEQMDPEMALRENKENFSFDISTVKKADVNRNRRQGSNKNSIPVHYWEVIIETRGDKFKFESDSDPSEPMSRAFGIR
jgi:hypothetical protein